MRLTYRGTVYDQESNSIESTKSNGGFYRGGAYSFSYPKHIPQTQRSVAIAYRGVDFRANTAESIARVADRQIAAPMTSRLQTKQAKLKNAALAHHQNIQRSLEHRLDVAKQQGDRSLIQQLEREMQMM